MAYSTQTIINAGMYGYLVDVECKITNGLPSFYIVGSASRSTDEARERVRSAYDSAGVKFPRKRIVINLAPADITKNGTSLDLAIAVAVLATSELVYRDSVRKYTLIGELGLDGAVRGVRGVIGMILAGKRLGKQCFIIPRSNLEQVTSVPDISLFPVDTFAQVVQLLANQRQAQRLYITPSETSKKYQSMPPPPGLDFCDIAGQEQAKRALEIAIAGGHNILLSGPPGTGKSMLAKASRYILPPLTADEILEVTHLHSLRRVEYESIISDRPFRAPHHSASNVSMIGGGQQIRPGEISLSHRGILFLDELPEFSKATIEALRQPLEDGVVVVSRAQETTEFPANFILIGTANPCPCGNYGSAQECTCSVKQIEHYRNKLSGPILDRIDLHCNVHAIDHERILSEKSDNSSQLIRSRIINARHVQSQRYNSSNRTNSSMSNSEVRHLSKLDSHAKNMLNVASNKLNLSIRAYMRCIKVARTIADLANSTSIAKEHLSEALQYRQRPAV